MTTSTAASTGRRIRGLDADDRRAQRRTQLLDAALTLFAENGYQSTSIEQICSAAYVGTKGFYEVFDSREACFVALVERVSEQVTTTMVDALATAPKTFDEAAPVLIAAFAHALIDDTCRAKVVFGEGGTGSSTIEQRRRANRQAAATFIQAIWQRYDIPGAHPAIALGVAGGLFDIIACWLFDLNIDPHSPAAVENLVSDLLLLFETVHAGLNATSHEQA